MGEITRGRRYLEYQMHLKQQGFRSVLLFVVQREDCALFRPATAIDPVYADTLRQAVQTGVEILVHSCIVEPRVITLHHALPWELD